MTLKAKTLIFSFLTLTVLIASVLILQVYKSTNNRLFNAIILLDAISRSADKIVIEAQNDSPDIASINKRINAIPGISRQLQDILPSTNQPSKLVKLGVSFIRIGRVVDKSLPGKLLEKPLLNQIRNETIRIEEVVDALRNLTNQEIVRLRAQGDIMIAVLILVLISYIIGVVYSLFKMVIQPVLMFSDQVKEVREGTREDITFSSSKDEIGELANEFNQMINKRRHAEEGLKQEITEHKRTVEDLRYSQSTLKTVFDSSLPMCITSTDYEVIHANEPYYAVFGEIDETAGSVKCYESRFGENCHTELCPLKQIMQGKEYLSIESVKPDHEGNNRHYLITARPFLGAEGEFVGVIETFQDITKLKKAEKQKLEMEKQVQHVQKLESLGVLAGGIAHDFNNILVAILGNADLTLYQLSKTAPIRSNIEDIITASQRASELCKQMLAYSGKGKFIVQLVDLNIIVREMGNMLEVSTSKKAVLRYNLFEELPSVQADITQVRQIIMNLITNASEAIGDKGGMITITTGAMHCDQEYLNENYQNEGLAEGQYTYIEVSDDGCGMEEETINKIFEPFFSTKFTGRGLGMAATLGIVRGHDGAIRVYSELGKGSSIKILFPAAEDQAPELVQKAPDDVAEWQGNGTILIIDDEDYVRKIGEKILTNLGFHVLLAAGGQEGIKLFSEHTQDIKCILLDLTMPLMDGEETYRELRKIQKDVKVILSSGYNQQEITQRFAGKSVAGFIQKPYRIKVLKAELLKILEG